MCNDEDRQARPMKARKDFKPTLNVLACVRQEQGRQNSSIAKNERMKQKTIRWSIASRIGMDESKLEEPFLATFNIFSKLRQHEHQDAQCREHQDTQWQDHQWRDHMWWEEWRLQTLCKIYVAATLQDSCAFIYFVIKRRLHAIAMPLQAMGGEDRTRRCTHIFLILVSLPHWIALFTRTCARVG